MDFSSITLRHFILQHHLSFESKPQTVSDRRDFVHGAATLFYNHVREFCHLNFSVISLFHQIHHGQRRALQHRAGPLPISIVSALGLLASSSASERLVPGRLNDPVLSPGELTEVDEMLLPATLTAAWAGVTVTLGSVGMTIKELVNKHIIDRCKVQCMSYKLNKQQFNYNAHPYSSRFKV